MQFRAEASSDGQLGLELDVLSAVRELSTDLGREGGVVIGGPRDEGARLPPGSRIGDLFDGDIREDFVS